MVMEPPSPQCVGREFVRQYYTLLNQAPLHLHRFYSHNSSFLHGGGDIGDKETEAVYGQQDIHQKIMQLNFRDCHAKIRQVDSHATLERGVVVQVSGELSNNGQPMRRFMQTFVLAPQSPKKYYVHNDIFRYQDEVFNDEEVDNVGTADTSNTSRDNGGTTTRDNGGVRTEEVRMEEPMDAIIKPAPVPVVMQEVVKPVENVLINNEPPHLNGSSNYTVNVEDQPGMEVEDPAAQAMGVWKPEMVEMAEPTPVAAPSQAPEGNVWNPAVPPPNNQAQATQEEGSMDEQEDDPEESPMTPTAEVPVSNEPRTWSSIASGGSKAGGAKPPMAPAGQPSVPPSRSDSKEGTPSSQYGGSAGKPYRGNRGTSQGRQSTGSGPSGPGGPRPERFSREGDEEQTRTRMASVSDSQQLFVGNLPHNCTEQDLRELFSTFGKVTDLRINQKTGRENQSKPGREGVKVPNFGFIVFDNGEAVEKALKAKPIMLFGNHRLNVEEKKMRTPRDNMGGGQGGFNDRGPPGGGRGERGSQFVPNDNSEVPATKRLEPIPGSSNSLTEEEPPSWPCGGLAMLAGVAEDMQNISSGSPITTFNGKELVQNHPSDFNHPIYSQPLNYSSTERKLPEITDKITDGSDITHFSSPVNKIREEVLEKGGNVHLRTKQDMDDFGKIPVEEIVAYDGHVYCHTTPTLAVIPLLMSCRNLVMFSGVNIQEIVLAMRDNIPSHTMECLGLYCDLSCLDSDGVAGLADGWMDGFIELYSWRRGLAELVVSVEEVMLWSKVTDVVCKAIVGRLERDPVTLQKLGLRGDISEVNSELLAQLVVSVEEVGLWSKVTGVVCKAIVDRLERDPVTLQTLELWDDVSIDDATGATLAKFLDHDKVKIYSIIFATMNRTELATMVKMLGSNCTVDNQVTDCKKDELEIYISKKDGVINIDLL